MIKINLLPKEFKPRTQTDYWMLGYIILLLGSAGTIFYLHSQKTSELASINAEITSIEEELLARGNVVAERDGLQQQQKEMEVYGTVSQQLQQLKSKWSEDLALFVNRMPLGQNPVLISLNTMSMKPATGGAVRGKVPAKDFTIQGVSRTQPALAKFVKSFENDPSFSLQFQGTQTSETGYTFTMNIGLLKSPTSAAPSTATPGATP